MYLDPGFGSMLIQMVIAAFAACSAVFFMMKNKLKKKWGKNKEDASPASQPATEDRVIDEGIDAEKNTTAEELTKP